MEVRLYWGEAFDPQERKEVPGLVIIATQNDMRTERFVPDKDLPQGFESAISDIQRHISWYS